MYEDISIREYSKTNKMSPVEAAKYLGISKTSLANLRYANKGPKYVKIGGRLIYYKTYLDDYLEKCTINPEN